MVQPMARCTKLHQWLPCVTIRKDGLPRNSDALSNLLFKIVTEQVNNRKGMRKHVIIMTGSHNMLLGFADDLIHR